MKREEKQRLNNLIRQLQSESAQKCKRDLATLQKPYYFKGRFNSLSNKEKRAKIREYYENEKNETKAEIIALYECEELKSFNFSVEWSKNRTWGYNPHCRCVINGYYVGYGSASGCGYDKLSASVYSANNDNDNAKRIVLGAIIKKFVKSGEAFPYGIYKSNKIYLHYDGCGISTLLNILKYCGLVRQVYNETKTSDFLSAERE